MSETDHHDLYPEADLDGGIVPDADGNSTSDELRILLNLWTAPLNSPFLDDRVICGYRAHIMARANHSRKHRTARTMVLAFVTISLLICSAIVALRASRTVRVIPAAPEQAASLVVPLSEERIPALPVVRDHAKARKSRSQSAASFARGLDSFLRVSSDGPEYFTRVSLAGFGPKAKLKMTVVRGANTR